MELSNARDPRPAPMQTLETAHPRGASGTEMYDDEIDLREYLEALAHRWRLLAAATIAAMLATAIVVGLAMTKWYRAEAIIRPITANAVQGRLSGLFGGIGGLGGVGGLGGGLLGGEASNPASEYMPVLKSFDFTSSLVAGHSLAPHLPLGGVWLIGGATADPQWARYRLMRKRFDCEFSLRTGNLTLYYQDPNRAMAEKVLGFYIGDLRERMRHAQIRDATEAIASLRDEIRDTADNLLQTQLYELLARQIQQQKLAQVQADFAFKVLVAPTASDQPYQPKALLDAVLAGMLAFMLASAVILWRNPAPNAAPPARRAAGAAPRRPVD